MQTQSMRVIGRDEPVVKQIHLYHKIPATVSYIMAELDKQGFKSFIVGGAVRDMLIDRKPKDFDVSTDATPEQVKSIFGDDVYEKGAKYGTMAYKLAGGNDVDITTFRVDGDCSVGRHPDSVEFTNCEIQDVKRRDATINALLYKDGAVIDHVGGLLDLFDGRIRAVGDPADRVKLGGTGDPLRILRYIRQAAQLHFQIANGTLNAINLNRGYLNHVSNERIREELTGILMSANAGYGLRLLAVTGVLDVLLPSVAQLVRFNQHNSHHDCDAFEHTIRVVEKVPYYANLRWAALLHDVGKPYTQTFGADRQAHYYQHHVVGADVARKALTDLRFPLDDVQEICTLIYEHMSRVPSVRPAVRRLVQRIGSHDLCPKVIDLMIGDVLGHAPPYKEALMEVLSLELKMKEVIESECAMKVTDLAINGHDMMGLGAHGKHIGIVLRKVLDAVVDGDVSNDRHDQLNAACVIYKELIDSNGNV